MKVLTVNAHPDPKSPCRAVLDEFARDLGRIFTESPTAVGS